MRMVKRRISFSFHALGKGTMICAAALALVSAFAAGVEWPSDFDEQLAAHIAAEKSTNTTCEVYSMQVDACYRTIGTYELAVSRMPGSGFYIIVK